MLQTLVVNPRLKISIFGLKKMKRLSRKRAGEEKQKEKRIKTKKPKAMKKRARTGEKKGYSSNGELDMLKVSNS